MEAPSKKKKIDESTSYKCPIADPVASKSLGKKIVKLAAKCNSQLVSEEKQAMRGVKEVVKTLRKNKKGIVILAADITPIELVAHIPIMCEDRGVPYIYVASKDFLGQASLSKNPTTVLMLLRPSKKTELYADYKQVYQEISEVNPYMQD